MCPRSRFLLCLQEFPSRNQLHCTHQWLQSGLHPVSLKWSCKTGKPSTCSTSPAKVRTWLANSGLQVPTPRVSFDLFWASRSSGNSAPLISFLSKIMQQLSVSPGFFLGEINHLAWLPVSQMPLLDFLLVPYRHPLIWALALDQHCRLPFSQAPSWQEAAIKEREIMSPSSPTKGWNVRSQECIHLEMSSHRTVEEILAVI